MRMLNAIFHNSGSYTDKTTTNWRIVVFYTIFFIYTINCMDSSSCMDQQQQSGKQSPHCRQEGIVPIDNFEKIDEMKQQQYHARSMREREMVLLRKQRELHNQLKDLYLRQKKLKSERDALVVNDDEGSSMQPNDMDFEFEIPSYCSNCLGDIMQPPYKSSLSSEYSRKLNGDDETINLQDDINVPQLSDHSRLESIKHQILLKLGMKNKPNITDSLPKQYIYDTLRRSGEPVINDFIYHSVSSSSVHHVDQIKQKLGEHSSSSENSTKGRGAEDGNESHKVDIQSDGETDFDDFYGKPREIITFAELGQTMNGHHLLEFPTPVDSQTSLENAKLKIHKATLFIKLEKRPSHSDEENDDDETSRGDDDVSQLHDLMTTRNARHQHHQHLDTDESPKRVRKKRIRKDDDITNDSRHIFSSKNNKNHIKTNENNENHINNNEIEKKRKLRKAINVDNIKLNSAEINSNNLDMKRSRPKANVTLWIFQPRKSVHDVQFVDDKEFDNTFELEKTQMIQFDDSTDWQNIDVTTLVQKWFSSDNKDKQLLRLYVECSGCANQQVVVHPFTKNSLEALKMQSQQRNNNTSEHRKRSKDEKIEIDKSNRPYLAVHIEPATLKRFKRRALDCSVATKSQCCKQRFYVSFKALGWDDWIIAPPGYYANYCSGKCGNGLHRTPDMFPTYYSHVVHEVRKYNKLNGNQLCCAPLKFSSMSLIYFGPDSKIIKRDLPKMVVDECGCP